MITVAEVILLLWKGVCTSLFTSMHLTDLLPFRFVGLTISNRKFVHLINTLRIYISVATESVMAFIQYSSIPYYYNHVWCALSINLNPSCRWCAKRWSVWNCFRWKTKKISSLISAAIRKQWPKSFQSSATRAMANPIRWITHSLKAVTSSRHPHCRTRVRPGSGPPTMPCTGRSSSTRKACSASRTIRIRGCACCSKCSPSRTSLSTEREPSDWAATCSSSWETHPRHTSNISLSNWSRLPGDSSWTKPCQLSDRAS